MTTQIHDVTISRKLSEYIAYYEICNRAEGKSPKTISWYSSNLRRFQNYLKNKHLPDSLNNIDIKLLREYVIFLFKRKKFDGHPYTPMQENFLSSASVHAHVRTLRAFFNWLVLEGLMPNSPAQDLKPPKVIKRVVSILSNPEIESILNTLSLANPSEARNRTIFMILLDSGLRIGELVNLNMGDTHIDEGFLKVLGKGKKERIVPIGRNAQKALQRYLFRYRVTPTLPITENRLSLNSWRPFD